MGAIAILFFVALMAVSAVIGIWLERAENNR